MLAGKRPHKVEEYAVLCCSHFYRRLKKVVSVVQPRINIWGVSQTFNLILPLFVFSALALFCMVAPIVLSISGLLLEAKVSSLIPPLLFNTLPTPTPTSMTS